MLDDDIQRKVLAKPEEEHTLDKVEKFVIGEESGKFSLADTKAANALAAISGYRQQQKASYEQSGDGPTKQFNKCKRCGQSTHDPGFENRKKFCKAFEFQCG